MGGAYALEPFAPIISLLMIYFSVLKIHQCKKVIPQNGKRFYYFLWTSDFFSVRTGPTMKKYSNLRTEVHECPLMPERNASAYKSPLLCRTIFYLEGGLPEDQIWILSTKLHLMICDCFLVENIHNLPHDI
jgi:hypothetical protein